MLGYLGLELPGNRVGWGAAETPLKRHWSLVHSFRDCLCVRFSLDTAGRTDVKWLRHLRVRAGVLGLCMGCSFEGQSGVLPQVTSGNTIGIEREK